MAERELTPAATQAPSDDIWSKCPSCKEMAFRKEVERNLNVCPKCGYHFRVTVAQRLSISVDRGTWRSEFRGPTGESTCRSLGVTLIAVIMRSMGKGVGERGEMVSGTFFKKGS